MLKQEETVPTEVFPLVHIAMDWLEKDDDNLYRFRPHGDEAIKLALDALFASTAKPEPAIEELVGLAHVLQNEKGSPAAGDLIVKVLLDSKRARKLLGVGPSTDEVLDASRRFSSRFGKPMGVPARVDDKPPVGAKKLSDFVALQPISLGREPIPTRRKRRK